MARFVEIDFESLFIGENIRVDADKKSIKELAKVISTTNWIDPPLVQKIKDKYEIVAGERRFHAISLIRENEPKKFKKITVELFEGDELERLTIQAAENFRENLTTYEILQYIVTLREKFALDSKDISNRVGRSVNYVNTMIRMHAKVHPDILNALKRGTQIPFDDLVEYTKRTPEEQKESFEKWLGKQDPNNELEIIKPPARKMLPYRKAERLLNHLIKVKASPQIIMIVKFLMGQRKSLPGKLNPLKTGEN